MYVIKACFPLFCRLKFYMGLFTNAVFVLHPGQILPRSGCNGTPECFSTRKFRNAAIMLSVLKTHWKMFVWVCSVVKQKSRDRLKYCLFIPHKPTVWAHIVPPAVPVLELAGSHTAQRLACKRVCYMGLKLKPALGLWYNRHCALTWQP